MELPDPELADGSIRLRAAVEKDVAAIVAACQDPEIKRWTRVPDDYGPDDARAWIETSAAGLASGETLNLVIVDAEAGTVLGSCGLIEIKPDEQRCEIGYWLAPEARRKGVMSAALRLLCRWLFEDEGMLRIAAGIEPENPASQALVESLGFKREGTLRSLFEMKGRRRDIVYFSLLPGELAE